MRKFPVPATIACLLSVAACQTDTASLRPATTNTSSVNGAAPPQGFRCPPAGTVVNFDRGGFNHYLRVEADDPAVCVLTSASGARFRNLFNLVSLPAMDEAAARRSLAQLWPLEPGKTASFTSLARTTSGNTAIFTDRWLVARREGLLVGGETRDTVVLERSSEGAVDNVSAANYTFWLDAETGALLKMTYSVIRGNAAGIAPFEATRIRVPRQPG